MVGDGATSVLPSSRKPSGVARGSRRNTQTIGVTLKKTSLGALTSQFDESSVAASAVKHGTSGLAASQFRSTGMVARKPTGRAFQASGPALMVAEGGSG